MRWSDLFADLEAQVEALETAERAAEIDERTRLEVGRIGLADRVRAALGAQLVMHARGGLTVRGALSRVGPDWLLVDEGGGRETLLALGGVLSVAGTGRFAAAGPSGAAGMVAARLGLRNALRGVARDRSTVRVHLLDGAVVDATIDRVGSDFVELARHPAGEPRRRGEVRDAVLVPFAALVAVRRVAG